MKCPYCGNEETKVVDSRISSEGDSIKRRRECIKCEKRFTTYEKMEIPQLYVKKKSGGREPFKREKVLRGLFLATEKRDVSPEKINNLVDELEEIIQKNHNNEIESKELGDIILEKLLLVDEVAYIRFASVYQKFADLRSFVELIEKVQKAGRR